MALVIAVLCGLVAALTALIVSRHLGASALQSLAYAGGSFLAGTAFASAVQEKLGLF
ncbi:hypothetical protein ACIRBX_03560 [Kitasatospora sp. NPDC096147]|uniref:hypothetical protein n=1 Tax=Kitasatospora sp. NPDC096147 TaxID=3364093 RepID=UPI00380DE0A7